jgi:hypothetical protein
MDKSSIFLKFISTILSSKSFRIAITNQLNELDYVKIDLLFQIQQVIGFIVRDLLQSPDRGHFRFFWQHDTELSELLIKRSSWNIDSKLATLQNRKKNISRVKNVT